MVMLCFTVVSERVGHRFFSLRQPPKEDIVGKIATYVQNENDDLSEDEVRSISETVYEESREYDLDYRLVLAVMKVESNFRCNVVSRQGARGLLQVKPSLAKSIAIDKGIQWTGAGTLDEPDKNIQIGIHLLSELMGKFETTVAALHAYNVGPTRLKERAAEKNRTPRGFSKLVLTEYKRNISVLPEPEPEE